MESNTVISGDMHTKRESLEEKDAEELKRMARDKDLPDYSRMSKSELVDLVDRNYTRSEIESWSGAGGETYPSPRDIIDSMVEGVVITDTELRILQANRAVRKMFGYEAGEAIGKTVHSFIEEGREEVDEALQKTIDEGVVKEVEFTAIAADGERFPVSVNGTVLRDEEGEPDRVIITFRDITERKEREAERLRRETVVSTSENVAGGIIREFGVRTSAEELGLRPLLKHLAELSTSPSPPQYVYDLMITGIRNNLREKGVEADREEVHETVAPFLWDFLEKAFELAGEFTTDISPEYEEFEDYLAP